MPSPPINTADSASRPNPDRNGLDRSEADDITHVEQGQGISVAPWANVEVVDHSERSAQAETSIQISLKDRYLTLLDDGKVIGKYPVAIGAPESPTPAGSYAVTKMDPQPTHQKKGKVIAPGPSNPVGVRCVTYVQICTGE